MLHDPYRPALPPVDRCRSDPDASWTIFGQMGNRDAKNEMITGFRTDYRPAIRYGH